jgi:hypothetical protein
MKSKILVAERCHETSDGPKGFGLRRLKCRFSLLAWVAGLSVMIQAAGCVAPPERDAARPWNSPDFMDRNRHSGDPGLEGRGFWNTPANRPSNFW